MRILFLDTETSANTAYVWKTWKENISLDQLIDTSRLLCVSYKWQKEKKVSFLSEWTTGREEMIKQLWELIDTADVVVGFNHIRFDMPVINKEFLLSGLTPPSPYKMVDLYQVVKKNFRFTSNKLAHIAEQLGVGAKVSHEGFKLWVKVANKDKAAQKRMERYCIQDTRLLQPLYDTLLPWIKGHPNYAVFNPDVRPVCPHCGSSRVQSRGTSVTQVSRFRRYVCTDCGSWSRERISENRKPKLVGVV